MSLIINEDGTIEGAGLINQQDMSGRMDKLVAIANAYQIDSPDMRLIGYEDLSAWKGIKKDLTNKRLAITRPLDESKKSIMAMFNEPLSKLDMAIGIVESRILTFDNAERAKAQAEQRRLDEIARQERAKAFAEAEAIRIAAEAEARAKFEESQRLQKVAQAASVAGDTQAAREALEQAAQLRQEAAATENLGAAKAQEAETAAHLTVAQTVTVEQAGGRVTWKGKCHDKMALIRFVAEHPEYEDLLDLNAASLNSRARSDKEKMNIGGCVAYEDRSLVASRK